MISNELLREALALSLEETIAFHKRASEENPHRFSLAYKIRKRSIIKLAERYETEKTYIERYKTEKPHTERHFMPLRRLALFMAIIAAAVVLSVGAYAAYLIINGFVFDRHETYSDVTLDLSEYGIKDSITEVYGFSPESGVEYIKRSANDKEIVSEFQFNNKRGLFTQYAKYPIENIIGTNTENSDLYEINFSENNGFAYIRHTKNGDENTLIVWVKDGYVFSISSIEITGNELVSLCDYLIIEDYID